MVPRIAAPNSNCCGGVQMVEEKLISHFVFALLNGIL